MNSNEQTDPKSQLLDVNVPSLGEPVFQRKLSPTSGLAYCYKGNHFPHWVTDSAIYHVSFHLADSVPLAQRQLWLRERQELLAYAQNAVRPLPPAELRRLDYLFSDKIEAYLDAGYGSCVLRNPLVANVVKESLLFFNLKKYILHAWCIMPNHVHVILHILDGFELSKIIHSWKSYTSHCINKLINRSGQLWQIDSYNHIIRTREEYFFQVRYVWNNPDKASLMNWNWRWMCLEEHDFKVNSKAARSGGANGGSTEKPESG